MSFRLLRVKRRADQDPATALYLPIEDDSKRTKTDTEAKEFKLFKIVERGDRQPVKIAKPTERTGESKVVLLSNSTDTSTVAEAILVDNENKIEKQEISKMIRKNDIGDRFDSFNINEEMDGDFVYDVYRLDLGRFTEKDIEGRANCIQIVTYEQEFLNDEEGSESETYEDEDDSNAEDYYANYYPDEESYISKNDKDYDSEGEGDDLLFDESVEIEDFEFNSDGEFLIDLGSAAEDSDYYFSQSSEEYDWDEYFRGEYNDSEDERIAKYYYSKCGESTDEEI